MVALDATTSAPNTLDALRHDDVLERWNETLKHLDEAALRALRDRKIEQERLHAGAIRGTPEAKRAYGEAKARYLEQKRDTDLFRSNIARRRREARRLIHERNRRRQASKGIAHDGTEAGRLKAVLEHHERRADDFRKALHGLQDFLLFDVYFRPEYLPARDAQLARIESTLFPNGRKTSTPPPTVPDQETKR